MKTCTRCGETKVLDEYHRLTRNKDGRRADCKECCRALKTEYSARPEVMARKAEYKQSHPEVWWEYTYCQRATAYGFTPMVVGFTREALIEQWGDQCFHCRGTWSELDHYPVPVAHGGAHTIENARPSCVSCNRPGGAVSTLTQTDIGETA